MTLGQWEHGARAKARALSISAVKPSKDRLAWQIARRVSGRHESDENPASVPDDVAGGNKLEHSGGGSSKRLLRSAAKKPAGYAPTDYAASQPQVIPVAFNN